MEKERKEWEEGIAKGTVYPAKIEVGGCPCTKEQDIFEILPLAIYGGWDGGWDGTFDPNIKMGELKKEGDVALNVCPTCLGSITWRVLDDTGRAYFELPY